MPLGETDAVVSNPLLPPSRICLYITHYTNEC